jgi:hypothetical protein
MGVIIFDNGNVSLLVSSSIGLTFGGISLESYLMIKEPEIFSPQEITDLLGSATENTRSLELFKEILLERCPYNEVQLFLRLER